MMKTIVIFGANGFLGRYLSDWFAELGWRVIGVARKKSGMSERAQFEPWDAQSLGPWVEALEGATAVVNLAGRSVNCRYHQKNRDLILTSRVQTTELIDAALRQSQNPPEVLLNSSTATIYRHAEDRPQSESTGEIGKGFSVEVAQAWERAFFKNELAGVRKIALRTAMVLGNEPGTVFDYLFKISQLGLGGKMSHGRQRVSWIHLEDFCRALLFLIENKQTSGSYNIAAPEAVTNEECMAEFRKISGRSFGLPASRWMLEIGTFLMRTETELVLKSRWVVPERLSEEGFRFRYSDLRSCLEDLIKDQGLKISPKK